MTSRKPTLILTRDKRGNSGLYVYPEDVLLLEQVMIHQSMRATAIHEFFMRLTKHLNKKNSITNRLGKLQAAGLLIQSKVKLRGSYYLYHYRLGTRGIEILVKLNVIQPGEQERVIEHARKFHIPSEHTEAMSQISNKVFLTAYENKTLTGFEHARGINHPAFGHSIVLRSDTEETKIVPDWVFSFGDTIVCIEIDTGSQRQSLIEQKYKSYIKHARRLMNAGKRVIVLFSVVDGSIMSRFTESRDKRITSIKQLAPPFKEWVKPGVVDGVDRNGLEEGPLRLQFYAVSARRTPQLVESLLSGSHPFSPQDRRDYAGDWIRKARYVLSKDKVAKTVDVDDVFLPRRDRDLDSDAVLSLTPTKGGDPNLYSVIYGEEGSIMTFQLISTNGARITKLNEREGENHLRMLVCYDNEPNMLEDVYGKDLTCEMWQTDSASWVEAMNQGDGTTAPELIYAVSQFRKERRALP